MGQLRMVEQSRLLPALADKWPLPAGKSFEFADQP